MVEKSLIFFCLCEEIPDESAFAFLNDLKTKLLKGYNINDLKEKSAFGLRGFEDVLQHYMNYYNSYPSSTKTGEIIKDLNLAKDAAIQNIEKIFQREEIVNIIATKSSNLENLSFNVSVIAENIKKQEKKKNMNIIFIFLVIIVILILLYFLI